MSVSAWAPLGAALRAFQDGDRRARLVVESDLFATEQIPVSAFYRPAECPLPPLERTALQMCRGRTLDVGAGAGRHALELQAAGLRVRAVDVDPAAVEVMRRRGVREAAQGDVRELPAGPWDTLVMLMNGLGVVGDLAGLDRFLTSLDAVLKPDGQLLCDSADLAAAFPLDHLRALGRRHGDRVGRGEARFRLRFGRLKGAWYPWLFCSPGVLRARAGAAGWWVEIAAVGDRGGYLARLARRDGSLGR